MAVIDIVNEKSTAFLTISFKDENGATVTPNSGTYKIDDILSGTSIKTSTNFTPSGPTYEIVLTSTENAILNSGVSYETKLVTVTFLYDSSTKSGSNQFIYKVKNLSKVA